MYGKCKIVIKVLYEATQHLRSLYSAGTQQLIRAQSTQKYFKKSRLQCDCENKEKVKRGFYQKRDWKTPSYFYVVCNKYLYLLSSKKKTTK